MPATYRAFTASTDFSAVARYLSHVSVAENAADSGGEARVLLRDGGSGGQVVLDIRLAAKESKHISFTKPLFFPNGIYVLVSTGTVRGSIDAT